MVSARRRPVRGLVPALAVIALLAGCAGPGSGNAAVVNESPVPAQTVERLLRAQIEGGQLDPSLSGQERARQLGERQRQVLTSLIRIEVLAQVAEDEGVEVTREQLDERFQQEAEAQGGEESLEQLIDQSGLTPDDFRELVLADLVRQESLQEALGGGEEGGAATRERITSALAEAEIVVASRFGSWSDDARQVVATDLIADDPPAPGGGGTPTAPSGEIEPTEAPTE